MRYPQSEAGNGANALVMTPTTHMFVQPNSDPFLGLSPRQDSVARLLLLISKVELTDAQRQEAHALATQITDWDRFAKIAARKFAVTYALRHLQTCAEDLVSASALENMRMMSRAATMSSLRVAAANIAFHKSCILPTGASYAYLKGMALALQNGQAIGERFCRDIDVLVAPEHFRSVLECAVAANYQIVFEGSPAQLKLDSQDFRFLAKYPKVVTLVGPDSIPIEVHKRLDNGSVRFDVEQALSRSVNVDLADLPVKVLRKPDHFIYVCYHHSRHFWSHLHWLADLDAFARAPDLDRREVETIADKIGIRPTIDAAFEFHDLVSRPGLWEGPKSFETRGGQFLKACLVNLEGDLELEKRLRKDRPLNDFMSAWQISSDRYTQFLLNYLSSALRPSESLYIRRKVPSSLYWIYSLQNTYAMARRNLSRAGLAAARALKGFAG